MSIKLSRRQFVTTGAAAALLAACGKGPTSEAPAPTAGTPTEAPAEATLVPEVEATQDLSNTNLEQIRRLSETKVSLRGFASPLWVVADIKSFNDQLFSKKMEELTNVHIGWEHAADWGDSPLELLMASGNLPDVIAGYGGPSFARHGQKGALEPLNDHIAANPYLSSLLKERPVIRAMITAPDGNIYSFPRVLQDAQRVFGGFFIRRDWLDEVGMPVPETTDEYYEVLKAMKGKDPNRYPLAGYFGDVRFLVWQWGVGSRGPNCPTDFYHDGDIVKYGPLQAEYKEALVYLNRLFSEGLLDPEYPTQNDPALVYKRWTDGIVGAGFGWSDDVAAISKADPSIDLVGTRPPKGPRGSQEVLSNHMEVDISQANAIGITSQYKDIAAAYTDLYYSDSGATLYNWGVYGDTYIEVDGAKQFTEKVTADPLVGSINEYLWNYVSPIWIGAGLLLDEPWLIMYSGAAADAMATWRQPPWQTIQMPPLLLSEDETNIVQQSMTDINTLLDESIAGFINGTKSLDEDYRAMVDTIRGLGIEDVIAAYQTAYDRFLDVLKG